MAETYIVKITTQAQGQMKEIMHYIASELKAPDAALHLLDALENAIASLSFSTSCSSYRGGTLAQ